ncbi:MAG: DUF4292 domain-containing protein [Bacteroidia bacterium]|nr:DUF4292 domain-containing protein [Bacteroidia bacterium]
MKGIYSLCIVFFFALLLGSCSSTKKSSSPNALNKTYKSPLELLDDVNRNNPNPNWLSTKTNIQYKTAKSSQSVNSSIRLKKDSAIWISVTPLLGIEVARVLITPDSVKYIDRFNKQYSAQNIGALKSYIPIEGDFYTLQNILLGNSFVYSENTVAQTVINKNRHHIISSLSKKQLKGVINKNTLLPVEQQSTWVIPEQYRIKKQLIISDNASHTITIDYDDYKKTDFGYFPGKTELEVNSESEIKIVLKHSKIQNNKHTTMPFRVPASYEVIN